MNLVPIDLDIDGLLHFGRDDSAKKCPWGNGGFVLGRGMDEGLKSWDGGWVIEFFVAHFGDGFGVRVDDGWVWQVIMSAAGKVCRG